MPISKIKTDSLSNDSITAAKIVGGAVDTSDIAAGSIDAAQLSSNSVITAKIANDAVTTDKLATQTGNVDFADNGKIRLGTGNDLQIYHDGSNSVIKDNGTGKLILDTDGASIEFQKSGLETLATFATDGAVSLYYDNASKLSTTSTGINITGIVDANDATIGDVADGTALIQMLANPTNGNNTIHFGDATSGADSYDGYINYAHDTRAMTFAVGGGEHMRITRDDGTSDGLIKIRGGVGLNYASSLGSSQVVLGIGTDNSYRSGVIFELASNQSLWASGFIKIKCAAGRNGLESRSAAEYLYRFQSFNEGISGIGLASSSGDTSSFTISVTEANANSSNGTVELKVKASASTNHGTSLIFVECGHYNGINRVRRGI